MVVCEARSSPVEQYANRTAPTEPIRSQKQQLNQGAVGRQSQACKRLKVMSPSLLRIGRAANVFR